MVSAISLFVMIGAFFWLDTKTVALRWVILVGTLTVFVVAILVDLTVRLSSAARASLPSARAGYPPSSPYDQGVGVLLLDPSDLFSQDAVVSVFSRQNDFERLIGVGQVLTIQDNGLIQVVVLKDLGSDDKLWERLRSNDATALRDVLVKPSIPRQVLSSNWISE